MSAGFLPIVSSCAWVCHVSVCFWKRLWTKFSKTEVGRGKAQSHGRPFPAWDCQSDAESQPFEVDGGCYLCSAGDHTEMLPCWNFVDEVFCEIPALHSYLSVTALCVAADWHPVHHLHSVQTGLSPQRVFLSEHACCFLTLREGRLLEPGCRVHCAGGTWHSVLARKGSSSPITFIHLQTKML